MNCAVISIGCGFQNEKQVCLVDEQRNVRAVLIARSIIYNDVPEDITIIVTGDVQYRYLFSAFSHVAIC